MAETFSVWQALRERFAPPAYAYLQEVRNGTGYARKRTRSADAIAMSLYPSRGLEIIGIEVKVSRSDWIREMKDPEKAEEIQRFCDRWYLAIQDEKIVAPGELPPTWGLLAPRAGRLVAKVEAPKLEPIPLDRLFVGAMLRRATEQAAQSVDPKEVRDEVDRLLAARIEGETLQLTGRANQAEAELRNLRAAVAAFTEASGIDIAHTWGRPPIGDAVRAILDGGADENRFANVVLRAQELARAAEEARAAVAELRTAALPASKEVAGG